MNTHALNKVLTRIEERRKQSPSPAMQIPGLWINPYGAPEAQSKIPEEFFHESLLNILAAPAKKRVVDGGVPGDWGKNAIAYNLLVRYGAAFDHDGDGRISCEPMASGWRETGTFLKAITMIPFIQSLGCNTIHLLPITSIGQDGNKGDMGSAFAIRDPYALDDHLAEPALGLGAETEFAAFVEAAHHLGIRVVVEFVFRTAAKDAAWAKEHPEWFYWIRADVPDRRDGEKSEETFGAPIYTAEELRRIYDAVGNDRFDELLPPHQIYRDMFTVPPAPETLRMENGCWRGSAPDPRTGELVDVRIPGAFCDWGPDSEQPPWTDVTYLRLYDHPDYNYMAYNTVRMYSNQLATEKNVVAPLWDKITEVIPHYQTHYRVDGVMIDMGHALPGDLKRKLVARARQVDPDFALWAEEFNLTPHAREEGYNVCVGPFMQTVRNPQHFRDWLKWIHESGLPVPFMAMAENHNTPRAVHWDGGAAFALYVQALGAFLPGVPYLHNGIELAEPVPVNTGFDFTNEEVAELPASILPLFSAAAMGWTRRETLVDGLRRIHALRTEHAELLAHAAPGSVRPMVLENAALVGYTRQMPGDTSGLAVIGNSDMHNRQSLSTSLPTGATDLLTGKPLPEALAPAQVVVCAV